MVLGCSNVMVENLKSGTIITRSEMEATLHSKQHTYHPHSLTS